MDNIICKQFETEEWITPWIPDATVGIERGVLWMP